MEQTTYSVVLLAAGSGTRFGGQEAKQWHRLGAGKSVFAVALEGFASDPQCVQIAVVARAHDLARVNALLKVKGYAPGDRNSRLVAVAGGDSREASTANGLAALDAKGDAPVLIHDAARPLVDQGVVSRVRAALWAGAKAVVPVLPLADTLKRAKDGKTVDRQALCRAQTPQGFAIDAVRAAHNRGLVGTDDASLMEAMGHPVTLVDGSERLHKITTPSDVTIIEAFMSAMSAPIAAQIQTKTQTQIQTRVGFGFDVHAFMAKDNQALDNGDIAHRKSLVLGGVDIPKHEPGAVPLAGHSDADVVLHSLTDAILGAMADGDIGSHFPPSDPQWRGASSDRFLAHAMTRTRANGGEIVNLDITVICERPRIGPYRDQMRATIATICGIAMDQVSVKASTTERLGFTGRGEGIACQALANLVVTRDG